MSLTKDDKKPTLTEWLEKEIERIDSLHMNNREYIDGLRRQAISILSKIKSGEFRGL